MRGVVEDGVEAFGVDDGGVALGDVVGALGVGDNGVSQGVLVGVAWLAELPVLPKPPFPLLDFGKDARV